MKISNLLETITPSSSTANTNTTAPKFGRSDKFLEEETIEETTSAGAVASVNAPIGRMQRRGKGSIFNGIKTSEKFPNSKAVKEGVDPQNFDSDVDYYNAVKKQGQQQFSGDWDVWDEIASLENQIKYATSTALRYQLRKQIDQLKQDAGIADDDEDEYENEYDADIRARKGLGEADEWEEDTEKRERFLKYAKEKLIATAKSNNEQFIQVANALSQQDNKIFGSPFMNTDTNVGLGSITITRGENYTAAINNIVHWLNSDQGRAQLAATSAAIWLTPEGKDFLERVVTDLRGMIDDTERARAKHAAALSGYQVQHLGGKTMVSGKGYSGDPKEHLTQEVSDILEIVNYESVVKHNKELAARIREEEMAVWEALPYPMKVAVAAAAGTTPDGFKAALFGKTEAEKISGYFGGKAEFDKPKQQAQPEDEVAEAKKANTKTARKEFGNRVSSKPKLSDKEKETKQSEEDRLWAMLQQHIADSEKKKEVKEANKFFKPGPAVTGNFPEPRKPKPGEEHGPFSKSETLGDDGLIYHWQDPRAHPNVKQSQANPTQVKPQGMAQRGGAVMQLKPNEPNLPAGINGNATCKVCGTPYKSHFRFDAQGNTTHTLVRHPMSRDLAKYFPDLNTPEVTEAQWYPDREYIPKAPRKRKPQTGNRVIDIRPGSPKIYFKNGKSVGEVGIDPEASPGNGSYYMKHYLSGKALIGYDTPLEAAKELAHLVRQEVDEGVGSDLAKLGGIAGLGIGGALVGNYVDQQQPKVEIGGKIAYVEPSQSRVPDTAMTLTGKDGKQYRVWSTRGTAQSQQRYHAVPVEGVKESKDDLSQYSTERLQAYVKKVSGGGVPAFGSGAQLKRVQQELKRREKGVAEGTDDEPFNYDEWKASTVKPRKPRGYKDAEAIGQQQKEIDRERKEKEKQGVAENAHGSENFMDIVDATDGDVRGIAKKLQYIGLHSEIIQFCYWAREQGIADIFDAIKLAKRVGLETDDENEMAYEGYLLASELLGLDDIVNEKSKSQAQFRTMAAVAHNPKFAKKVGIKQSVGKEFHKADKGINYKSLPKKVDEAEIAEEMIAQDLYRDLQIFKKGTNKDLSGKAKTKDLSTKPTDKEIIAKVTKK